MGSKSIHKLEQPIYYYTLGPNEPTLIVKNGDIVVTNTRDARGFDEKMRPLKEVQKQRSDVTSFRESNPLVGPIFVEEAQFGDSLAVTIQKIKLTRDHAWSRHIASFACLTGEMPGRKMSLNEPVPKSKFDWKLDLERNVGILALREVSW